MNTCKQCGLTVDKLVGLFEADLCKPCLQDMVDSSIVPTPTQLDRIEAKIDKLVSELNWEEIPTDDMSMINEGDIIKMTPSSCKRFVGED